MPNRLPHNALTAFRKYLQGLDCAPNTIRAYGSEVSCYLRAVEDAWDGQLLAAHFDSLSHSRRKLFRAAWRRFRGFVAARWVDLDQLPNVGAEGKAGQPPTGNNGREIGSNGEAAYREGHGATPPAAGAPTLPDAILWGVDKVTGFGISTRELAGQHWREDSVIPQRILFLLCAWSQRGAIPTPTDPILAREPGSKLGYPAKALGQALRDYRQRCRESGRALGQPPLNGPRNLAQALAHVWKENGPQPSTGEVWFTLMSEGSEVPLPGPLPASPSVSPLDPE